MPPQAMAPTSHGWLDLEVTILWTRLEWTTTLKTIGLHIICHTLNLSILSGIMRTKDVFHFLGDIVSLDAVHSYLG